MEVDREMWITGKKENEKYSNWRLDDWNKKRNKFERLLKWASEMNENLREMNLCVIEDFWKIATCSSERLNKQANKQSSGLWNLDYLEIERLRKW